MISEHFNVADGWGEANYNNFYPVDYFNLRQCFKCYRITMFFYLQSNQ